MQKSLGHKIKQLRELRDYTQDYMAQRLNISQAMYSKIERGEADTSFGQLTKIAKELDIDLTNLLCFDGSLMIHKVSEHQQGGQATGFVFNQGLSDQEKTLFERIIADKDAEIAFLRNLLNRPKP